MCVIAALSDRLLCVMLYSLCKVERIVLTELNEDYYYYYTQTATTITLLQIPVQLSLHFTKLTSHKFLTE